MTRKEILALPKRKIGSDEVLTGVCAAYIIPNRKKHSSGYMCMTVIASFKDKEKDPVLVSTHADDLEFYGSQFRVECFYPSGVISVWHTHGTFKLYGCSSLNFEEESK